MCFASRQAAVATRGHPYGVVGRGAESLATNILSALLSGESCKIAQVSSKKKKKLSPIGSEINDSFCVFLCVEAVIEAWDKPKLLVQALTLRHRCVMAVYRYPVQNSSF